MKKLLLLSIIYIGLMSALKATIITVDNNVNSPADYTDLQTAIDAATAGDTIYVAGSNTTYGAKNVTKKLNIPDFGDVFLLTITQLA